MVTYEAPLKNAAFRLFNKRRKCDKLDKSLKILCEKNLLVLAGFIFVRWFSRVFILKF